MIIISLFAEHLQKHIVTCPACQKGFDESAAYKHHVENVCSVSHEQKTSGTTVENPSSDSNSTNSIQENNLISGDHDTIGDQQELQSDLSSSELPSKKFESTLGTMSDSEFKCQFYEHHPMKKYSYGCIKCHKSLQSLYKLKCHVYSGTVLISLVRFVYFNTRDIYTTARKSYNGSLLARVIQ